MNPAAYSGANTLTGGLGVAPGIFGELLLVLGRESAVGGAALRNEAGTDTGAAYVFSRHQGGSNQWGLVKKLIPGDPGASDQFG
ncbi:MAG: hypothetical protein ABI563_18720, partial [Specibacter sp.]